MVKKEEIGSFSGRYRWLSNFYNCDVPMYHDGIIYPSAEHVYQAQKTVDQDERCVIARLATAADAKAAGAKLVLRDGWDSLRVIVMREVLRQKFALPPLRKMLVKTGTFYLMEGNTWGDVFWGVCRGQGRNMLGELLMEERSRILLFGATLP